VIKKKKKTDKEEKGREVKRKKKIGKGKEMHERKLKYLYYIIFVVTWMVELSCSCSYS